MSNEADRRQVLKSVPALAGLSALPVASADDVTLRSDDYGATQASLPTRSGVWSSVELGTVDDEESDLSVQGYHYDDEPSEVELNLDSVGAQIKIAVSPERARQIAGDLATAADYAETGEHSETDE